MRRRLPPPILPRERQPTQAASGKAPSLPPQLWGDVTPDSPKPATAGPTLPVSSRSAAYRRARTTLMSAPRDHTLVLLTGSIASSPVAPWPDRRLVAVDGRERHSRGGANPAWLAARIDKRSTTIALRLIGYYDTRVEHLRVLMGWPGVDFAHATARSRTGRAILYR